MVRVKAFYDIPPGLGEPLSRITFMNSITKTQIPSDDRMAWDRVVWGGEIISPEQVIEMMRQNPVNAAIQFFRTFLHKETGVKKCMNFIKNGNHILEIRLPTPGQPDRGSRIITHPLNETTFKNIVVWVMERVFDASLPSDGTTKETYGANITPAYHPDMNPLLAIVKEGLPGTLDMRKGVVQSEDGQVFEYESKAPGTFVAWMCCGCRKSFPLKARARRHQTTCPTRGDDDKPPKILGARIKYFE